MEQYNFENDFPTIGELILVYGKSIGYCLRSVRKDGDGLWDWYDENDDYVNAGEEYSYWWELPKLDHDD